MAVLLLTVMALSGCGKQAPASSATPAGGSQASAAPSADNQTRIVEHAMGKTEIKGNPQKVFRGSPRQLEEKLRALCRSRRFKKCWISCTKSTA